MKPLTRQDLNILLKTAKNHFHATADSFFEVNDRTHRAEAVPGISSTEYKQLSLRRKQIILELADAKESYNLLKQAVDTTREHHEKQH